MISVIVTSRVEGNVNHNLKELIRSIAEHSRTPEQVEVLIKFDYDDYQSDPLVREIQDMEYPFEIKSCLGPRGKGYTDIHRGYNQLLPIISQKTKIVIAMADDFRAERDWDNALRNAAQDAGDYFIIHQRSHPVPKKLFNERYNLGTPGINKFDMSHDMFDGEDLYIIDEAPAWSKKLIDICQMHRNLFTDVQWNFEGVFPVSFTDAWTLCLEYCLWHNYQINITRFLPELFISRKTCEVDQPGNDRWHTDRKNNFDYIKSEDFKLCVSYQAEQIAKALHIGVK